MPHHLHQLILNKFVEQITLPLDTTRPKCFIAYAWGDTEHEAFVQQRLAKDLQKAPVTVLLDVKDNSQLSSSISGFYQQIPECDFTLIVATPTYKLKAAPRSTRVVRQEYELMLGVYQDTPHKIIRWLRAGTAAESFPSGLGSSDRVYGDVTTDDKYYRAFPDLIEKLFNPILTPSSAFQTTFTRLRAQYLHELDTIEAGDSPELEALKARLEQHEVDEREKKKRKTIAGIANLAEGFLKAGDSDDDDEAAPAPTPDNTEAAVNEVIQVLVNSDHESFYNNLLPHKQTLLSQSHASRIKIIQLLQQSHRNFAEPKDNLRSLYCLDLAYELQTTLNEENAELTNTINTCLQKLEKSSLLFYTTHFRCLNIARYLLDNKQQWNIDIDSIDNIHHKTALIIATEQNNLELCQLLLVYSAKIKKGYLTPGYTALHIACEKGYEAIVDLFLAHTEKDSIINLPQSDRVGKNTSLHLASANAHHAIVVKLIEAGADPLAKNIQGYTPLQEVILSSAIAENKKLDQIACLLWEHSKTHFLTQPRDNDTLSWILRCAAERGLEAFVDELLVLDIFIPTHPRQRNILESTLNGVTRVDLIGNSLQISQEQTTQYQEARIRILLKFIDRMTIEELEKPFESFRGSLLHATVAKSGDASIIDRLLAKGVRPNLPTPDGSTALYMAADAFQENPEVVMQLYQAYPAALYETNGFDENIPLHAACSMGNIQVVRFLLAQVPREQRVAFVNTPSRSGSTALHKVVANNTYGINRKPAAYKEIVRLLITEGADLRLRDRENNTAAMLADRHGLEDLLDLITTARALPPAPTPAALTVLQP